jgi:hypothetical protein
MRYVLNLKLSVTYDRPIGKNWHILNGLDVSSEGTSTHSVHMILN